MDIEKLINLKPDEQIMAVLREDIAPYFGWIILIFFWIVAPFFFMFPLFRTGTIGVVVFFAVVVAGILVGLRKFYMWKRTVFIITDRRLVDVTQHKLFERVVSEIPFENIEDVSFRIRGVYATICRYGVIGIQTVGNAADIEFYRVRRPSHYHCLINDLREEAKIAKPRDTKSRKVEDIARGMSEAEIARLARKVRTREQKRAMKDFYEDEDEEDAE